MTCMSLFLNLLSRREYSTAELIKKAREKGFTESEITESIAEVQQKEYQSDTRLVAQLIISSQGKYGKSVIKRKCREKGISADLFEEVWESQTEDTPNDELSDLKAKVMRKYKIDNFQAVDQKTKGKLFNYLQYRGFNPYEVFGKWQKEVEDYE